MIALFDTSSPSHTFYFWDASLVRRRLAALEPLYLAPSSPSSSVPSLLFNGFFFSSSCGRSGAGVVTTVVEAWFVFFFSLPLLLA